MTSGRGLLKGCGLRGRGFIGVLVWWGLLLLGWIGRGLARVRFPGASRRNLRWSGLPPEGWGGGPQGWGRFGWEGLPALPGARCPGWAGSSRLGSLQGGSSCGGRSAAGAWPGCGWRPGKVSFP